MMECYCPLKPKKVMKKANKAATRSKKRVNQAKIKKSRKIRDRAMSYKGTVIKFRQSL